MLNPYEFTNLQIFRHKNNETDRIQGGLDKLKRRKLDLCIQDSATIGLKLPRSSNSFLSDNALKCERLRDKVSRRWKQLQDGTVNHC